ncbi:UBP-type domain-containing protein [Aphelenchoides bicaudatus]|nr:UBP-type domain-containing protein [Aphelenchoides bicaudatus]
MGEPNQKAEGAVSSDEEPVADGDNNEEQDERQYNRFDLTGYSDDASDIDLTQCVANEVPILSRFQQLKTLVLRTNLLKQINDNLTMTTLTELDLYDNQIEQIRGLDALVNLETLDLSYNRIKSIEGLSNLTKLERLFLVNNKISAIKGLESATRLKLLELGDNRIRKIENIGHLTELHELYLGKNKIDCIENLDTLLKLRILNIPGNRITKLQNLDKLVDLEELHISDQGITSLDGLENLSKITIIDAGNNQVKTLPDLSHMQGLEDLWLNDNKIEEWSQVEKLAKLAGLRTVYLERNPLYNSDRTGYFRFTQGFTRMATDEEIAQSLAREQEMGFAIEPLTTCPHLNQVTPLTKPIDVHEKCSKCADEKENWFCLTCHEVNCGRYVQEHGVAHHETTGHPLALFFSDLAVWCYECESYVHNPTLLEAKESAYKSKFPQET